MNVGVFSAGPYSGNSLLTADQMLRTVLQDIRLRKFIGSGAQDLFASEASLARLGALRL
jgi:hypothetical protein